MLAGELKLDASDAVLDMIIAEILILKFLTEFVAGLQTSLVQFELFPVKC